MATGAIISHAKASPVAILLFALVIDNVFLIISPVPVITNDPNGGSGSLAYVSLPNAGTNSDSGQVIGSKNVNSKTPVTLTALFDNLGDNQRWSDLTSPAVEELKKRHPELDITFKYSEFPYDKTRSHILNALSNESRPGNTTSTDLISIDQIWLGEFVQKKLLANLTDRVQQWGRPSDWYEENWDGGAYNDTVYGIWLWTDVRGMWYWKDLLNEAGVDPNSLRTWSGYIDSAAKLNRALEAKGIQGVHLLDSPHDPDMWYPYLWMLGGNVLEMLEGHPEKGVYWFPAYNSTAGVRALQFIKDQVDAGIKPQNNQFEKEFVDKKFAVMLAGSWMPGEFPRSQWPHLKQEVGFIPMFPVPNEGDPTATTMGGWELAIPSSSKNKDLAWELATLMAKPTILGPFLEKYGYLPTQKSIGEGQYSEELDQKIPYYKDMVSMIPSGRIRPNIPEYSQIASHIHDAISEVYYGSADPKEALDRAASRSAEAFGWN